MQRIKLQLKISLIIYCISYIIKTFILFKLTNPFEWILMIPTLTNDHRAIVLVGLVIYYLFVHAWIKIAEEEKRGIYK